LGRLKRPQLVDRFSIRAEILRGILKEIVLGHDGKNLFENAEEVDFQIYTQKMPKIPLFGPLKITIS
jgi:hypothetical protein